MRTFAGSDWRVYPLDPAFAATIYPQVVTLTRLLASPYWQGQGQSGDAAGQQRFASEVSRTVAPGYTWPHAAKAVEPAEVTRWSPSGSTRATGVAALYEPQAVLAYPVGRRL